MRVRDRATQFKLRRASPLAPRTRGAALDARVNEVLGTMQNTPDFSLCPVPALSPNRARVEAEAIGRDSMLALSWYRTERRFSGIESFLGSDSWKSIPALSWNRIGLFSIPDPSCQSRSVHLRPDSDIDSNRVSNRAHNRNRIGLGSGFDLFRNRIGFLGKDRFGRLDPPSCLHLRLC
jgi:hypothetical protein